jgi:nucleoside transporter
VFGTIGWIAANWVVSKGFHADTQATQFYAGGAAAITLGLFSLALPHTPPGAERKVSVRDVLGLDALALLRERSFAVFAVCSFLLCIPLAAYYAYASMFAHTVFHDSAFYMSFGQMSEILFMLLMPILFARLGVKWMMALGMLAWVVRYGLFSAAAEDHTRWMILTGIILHGMCYDFFFVTGFIYVDKKAPPEIRAQAQGFLVLLTQGLGLLIGAQLSGKLVAYYTTGEGATAITDWQKVWIVPSAAAAIVLLAFLTLFSQPRTASITTDRD